MTSLPRVLWLGLVAPLVAGCGVPLEGAMATIVNQCSSDAECGNAGVCRQDRCVSTKAQLAGLRLEVQLPSSSPYGAGTSSLIDLDGENTAVTLQGERPDGYVVSHDLVVPELVHVTGVYLRPDPRPGSDGDPDGTACTFADGKDWPVDGSLPVTAQFHPTGQPRGLPLEPYAATSTLVGDQGSYVNELSLNVPPGTYDIYVTVDPEQVGGCELPPVLIEDQLLDGSNVEVNVDAHQATKVAGRVEGVQDLQWALEGWTFELVDPEGGRRISTRHVFGTHAATEDWLPFEVEFFEQLSPGALIRLEPPDDASALPTFVWKLETVSPVGGLDNIGLELQDFANVAPLDIQGWVVAEDDGETMGARISVQSMQLLDGHVPNASRKSTTEAGPDGAFEVSVLPGKYQVTAVPGGSQDYAITAETWTILDSGGGQTIEVNAKPRLEATVSTTAAGPAFDVPVHLQPSTRPAIGYYQSVVETHDVPPNGATGVTNAAGAFAIAVDPGGFDVSVRPADGTGYPWLVRTNVMILAPPSGPPAVELSDLVISSPVVLRGTVRSPTGQPLAGAVIRGWLPVAAEGDTAANAATVVEIGQTVSDAQGRYALHLPASISQ